MDVMPDRRRPARTALLGLITLGITIVLAVAASELLLRVVYRDGGRRTLNGPGGQPFVHTFADAAGQLRGPMASGAKAPGTTRVMVLGDSITWGQGVTEWTDTYPARLLAALNGEGPRYDMAVFARPGKEIDGHAATIAEAAPALMPDIVVYQWYNNDVELSKARRPVSQRSWRGWPGHDTLKAWSYLYYALDFALDAYLPQRGRTYLQYLEEDYAEGTPGWQAFTGAFHTFAAYATGYASRTILLLYPPVPNTALRDLRQRVTALAAGQTLRVPAALMTHAVGALSPESVLTSTPGAPGRLAATPAVPLAHGDYTLVVRLRLDGTAAGEVATVRVTAGAGDPIAAVTVTAADLRAGQWTDLPVPFRLDAPVTPAVAAQVDVTGVAAVSVSGAELPVRYGIEVIDLAPHFGGMNTAASLFDAHPNAAAHQVMADVLLDAIRRPAGR